MRVVGVLWLVWALGCGGTPGREVVFAKTPQDRLIAVIDTDGDGKLTLAEAAGAVHGDVDLNASDTNQDGFLDGPEIRQILETTSPMWAPWPDPMSPVVPGEHKLPKAGHRAGRGKGKAPPSERSGG